MSDKKITPKEAALAVLTRANELFKASTLARGEVSLEKAEFNPNIKGVHNATGGASSAGIAARSAKRSMDHSKNTNASSPKIEREMARGATKDAKGYHKEVLGEMKQMSSKDKSGMGKSDEQGNNPDEKADPDHAMPMKGHMKLAKFMGRMEHKKGQKEMDKGETGHEKGINLSAGVAIPGTSNAGYQARAAHEMKQAAVGDHKAMAAGAKASHGQVLSDMKSQPKPKLPS